MSRRWRPGAAALAAALVVSGCAERAPAPPAGPPPGASAAAGPVQLTRLVAWGVPAVKALTVGFHARSAVDTRLVALGSPDAEAAELHTVVAHDGLTHMEPVADLPLPAGTLVKVGAGAEHIMLKGVRVPMEVGDSVRLVLRFATGDSVRVVVPVVQFTVGRGAVEQVE